MTREEAIELLQLNRGYCEGNDKAMVEALDMAIRSLKTWDKISHIVTGSMKAYLEEVENGKK